MYAGFSGIKPQFGSRSSPIPMSGTRPTVLYGWGPVQVTRSSSQPRRLMRSSRDPICSNPVHVTTARRVFSRWCSSTTLSLTILATRSVPTAQGIAPDVAP